MTDKEIENEIRTVLELRCSEESELVYCLRCEDILSPLVEGITMRRQELEAEAEDDS